jgi:hypothetical protein
MGLFIKKGRDQRCVAMDPPSCAAVSTATTTLQSNFQLLVYISVLKKLCSKLLCAPRRRHNLSFCLSSFHSGFLVL